MRRVVRWIGRGLVAVLALVLLAAAGAYAVLRNTVPADTGALATAGLAAPVEIVRDTEGVPHIFGTSAEDVHFAMGFVHAQDRLWQMELQRRTGAGRLSEVFGRQTLGTDIFLRTLDLYGHAERALPNLPADARAQLEAYAKGVNAFLTRRTGWFDPRLPPEFLLLRHAPEPWTAADSMVTVKLMALNLSTNINQELLRLGLAAERFTPAEIEDLLPGDPDVHPPQLPDLADLYPLRRQARTRAAALPIVDPMIGDGASNNWVVAGTRTKSGRPLLANDPHLRLSAPAIWYLAHVNLAKAGATPINAVGASLPGVPLIVVGRNDTLAWGFTNTGPDVQDVFIEKLNPDNPKEYLTPAGWRAFETRQIEIGIKGEGRETVEVRRTRHGPVLPDFFRGLGGMLGPNYVGALAWTALSDDDTTIAAGLLSAETRTVDDFFRQMQAYVVPMQSMVVADSEGNIGLIAPGRVPARDAANTIAGRAPVPGWDATYDWKGFLDYAVLPRQKNPQAGAIGTANARIVAPDYPHLLTYDWDARFRQQRVDELVVNRSGHDMASMQAAQADVLSPAVARLQVLMTAAVEGVPGVDQAVLAALRRWDGRQTRDSTEALIFGAWLRETMRELFADALGPLLPRYFDGRPAVLIRILEGRATGRDWCDAQGTAARETCGERLAQALAKALADLAAQYGPDRTRWTWGRAHVAISEHRPFGMIKRLAPYFNVEVESPGGDETLNRGKMDYGDERPFGNRHASSFRGIYDFADLEASLYMQTTGQSGNPLSPRYRSFAARWADVAYIKISTKRDVILREAAGTWALTPAR